MSRVSGVCIERVEVLVNTQQHPVFFHSENFCKWGKIIFETWFKRKKLFSGKQN